MCWSVHGYVTQTFIMGCSSVTRPETPKKKASGIPCTNLVRYTSFVWPPFSCTLHDLQYHDWHKVLFWCQRGNSKGTWGTVLKLSVLSRDQKKSSEFGGSQVDLLESEVDQECSIWSNKYATTDKTLTVLDWRPTFHRVQTWILQRQDGTRDGHNLKINSGKC